MITIILIMMLGVVAVFGYHAIGLSISQGIKRFVLIFALLTIVASIGRGSLLNFFLLPATLAAILAAEWFFGQKGPPK